MDWAESDSSQVTINLQFARQQNGSSRIVIAREDGSTVFEFDPGSDAVLKEQLRPYQGLILSCPDFRVGDVYEVFLDGMKMAYTGTDVMRHPGGKPPAEGGQPPQDGEGRPPVPEGEKQILFRMQDKVNFFSGLTQAQ